MFDMAKIDLGKIVNSVVAQRIPTGYTVGAKDGKGLPFDVKLSIDPDFKDTIIKGVTIFSAGVGAGIAAGIAINKRGNERRGLNPIVKVGLGIGASYLLYRAIEGGNGKPHVVEKSGMVPIKGVKIKS